MARYGKIEQADAKRRLLEVLKPGDTISTRVTNVSRSGMTRWVLPIITDPRETFPSYPLELTADVARVLGWGFDDRGVKVEGCGMDMAFHMTYTLSRTLFPTYVCPGDVCMSGDHVNWHDNEDGTRVPPPPRGGRMEHRDGYALMSVGL